MSVRGSSPVSVGICLLSLTVASGVLAVPNVANHSVQKVGTPPGEPALVGAGRSSARQVRVFVEMAAPAAAVTYAAELARTNVSSLSTPSAVKGAKAQAASVARAQIERNAQALQSVASVLTGSAIGAQEIYRATRSINGIAVSVDASRLDSIRRLPGVKAVRFLIPKEPNATSNQNIPFVNAPPVWNNSVGLGMNLTGAGVRVADIDTGLDYLHSNFGGTGTLASYQAAALASSNFTTLGGVFPTAKVVGGWDFAGDAYQAGLTLPVPDPNPMDCGGHGSHTAGTIAGFGVNADGSRYTGPYTPATPFSSMKIPPGVAPDALLYAYRIFGCGGSTDLVVPAIERAMDPNQDNNLADHVDVINMSLGSSYGDGNDPDSIASNNAALAGVAVAISAGNSGDAYFISGSPGSADRALTVAASVDPSGSNGAQLTVNAPGSIAGVYLAGAASFGPALTVAGVTGNVVLANDGSVNPTLGCVSGAWPGMTGNIALVDRGTCAFAVKAKNAQTAGAIGVIVANNASGVVSMGGSDPTITIPSLSISLSDGVSVKTALGSGTVNVTLAYGSFPQYADTLPSFSSRGPRNLAPIKLKPEVAAPGQNIVSTQTGVVCKVAVGTSCFVVDASGFFPDNQAATVSGTSMAAPHIAGTLALLRQLHPGWSVEELKAQLMNGSLHDLTTLPSGGGVRYGPGRVGAGREDVAGSAQAQVLAYSADDPGLVSVSFGTEVLGATTVTKTVHVVNHGTAPQTYQLAYDIPVAADGVSLSFPNGASVTVPAGTTVDFPVQLSATASSMNHTRDASVATSQVGNPRHWLTEEAGYVTFSQSSTVRLRLPVYSAPVPVSAMTGAFDNATTPTSVNMSGTDLCTGTLSVGPTCSGSFPSTVESLVTGLELHVVNPPNPNVPANQNIQYAGVSYDATDGILLFGLSTWGDWSHPSSLGFYIFIDNNNDGTWDKVLYNGYFTGAQDAPISIAANANFSGAVAEYYLNIVGASDTFVGDTRLFNTNVMFMAADPADLGITGAFRYKVETDWESVPGPFKFNTAAQGLNFGYYWLSEDLNGSSIPVTYSAANMTANGGLGALLLHHKNGTGSRAQVLPLAGSPAADIALSVGISPASPAPGQNVTVTYTATNNGPSAATGVVVNNFLPPSLSYVSDDAAGAYDTGLGLWTVGALANGASKTFHLVALVSSSGSITVTAQAGGTSPVDPILANNTARATAAASTLADLSVSLAVLPASVLPGANVTYTLVVTNNGPDQAFNVTVGETFPAFPSLLATGYTVTDGSFNAATKTWSIPSLAAGSSATLAFTVVTPIGPGPLTSQVTATSATADPNSADNAATATATILPAPDMQAIPTLSTAGLTLLALLIAGAALVLLRGKMI